MVDSIGKAGIGRSLKPKTDRNRKNFLLRTILKMKIWRDKARANLLKQRERYKQKVETNQKMTEEKKKSKLPNLNPSSRTIGLGSIPKSIHRYGLTHSTVPKKPKYSIVKPRERIYGNKWKKFEKGEL